MSLEKLNEENGVSGSREGSAIFPAVLAGPGSLPDLLRRHSEPRCWSCGCEEPKEEQKDHLGPAVDSVVFRQGQACA